MNAAGIAVFYGATEKETAVAELRPAVGSLITVAAFRVHRPIHVLDLTRFTCAGRQLDIFAKNQMVRATQWAFMQSFASEISQPILPGDEHPEYVPAQVVAEYLTNQPVRWRGEEVTPDAIMFRSAQRDGGKNMIAVMGDAATICRTTPAAGEDAAPAKRADNDLEALDFASPLSERSQLGSSMSMARSNFWRSDLRSTPPTPTTLLTDLQLSTVDPDELDFWTGWRREQLDGQLRMRLLALPILDHLP